VNENDKAYIAGLFDGEGSVTYSKRRQIKIRNNIIFGISAVKYP
jgi:hypothetical protein